MRRSQPWKTNRSRVLRANSTSAEDILWYHLSNRNLNGHKFVRQAPIESYFADFLCREQRFIIKVDGATHGEPGDIGRDLKRSRALEALGYKIFRIHNADIVKNIDGVLDHILAVLEERAGD